MYMYACISSPGSGDRLIPFFFLLLLLPLLENDALWSLFVSNAQSDIDLLLHYREEEK